MEKGKNKQRCHYCGGEIDYGSLVTSGSFALGGFPQGEDVLYRSSKNKKARISVACGTCIKCGHIELHLDPIQLKVLVYK